MTREEVEEIAEDAASKALAKLFLALGYDISDPKSVISMQEDLRFARRWRSSTETVQRNALKAAVTFITTGLLGWLGVLLYNHK